MTIFYNGEFCSHPQRVNSKKEAPIMPDKMWHAYQEEVQKNIGRKLEKHELYTVYWCWSKGVPINNVNL